MLRGVGKMGFEDGEDQARIGVHVATEGEERNAAVGDAEGREVRARQHGWLHLGGGLACGREERWEDERIGRMGSLAGLDTIGSGKKSPLARKSEMEGL